MLEIYRSVESFFLSPAGGLNIFGKLLKIGILYGLFRLVISGINKFIDRTFMNKHEEDESLSVRRVDTLVQTFKKAVKAVLYFFFILMILETFNIDTKSILATAGIGGVAIGFGAQSLVKDVINGFFILQENSYVVGDHVKIKEREGIVEDLGLRITKLRGFAGELHTIPNGEVQLITNLSRGANRAMVLVDVAYEENLDRAINVLETVCDDMKIEYKDDIVSGPKIDGVEELGDSGVQIRISGMMKPGEQWKIERVIRKKVKEALEREDIEIPYPRLVVYSEEE